MIPQNVLISHETLFDDILKMLEKNNKGFVIIEKDGSVTGVLTDGDIRRIILTKNFMTKRAEQIQNINFTFIKEGFNRENLLRILDSSISFLPVLKKDGSLSRVIFKEDFHLFTKKRKVIRSRAPVRISFGGGGSDITKFFANNGGAVLNCTISKYAHCVLKLRKDKKIVIESLDLNDRLEADSLEDLTSQKSNFDLIISGICVFKPDYGFELFVYSDFSIGSGLGGSSAATIAVMGCFNQLIQHPFSEYQLAELAFHSERIRLSMPGGWQDQYASVFGGVNFIEFGRDTTVVHPLKIKEETLLELEENLLLCNTHISHDSGSIHTEQRQKMDSQLVKDLIKKNVELTYKMRSFLLKGDLSLFGNLLHDLWSLKKQYSEKISNQNLDDIYNLAISSGALGGKLMGAGAGGYFLFYVPWTKREKVVKNLKENGMGVEQVKFENSGLQCWRVDE